MLVIVQTQPIPACIIRTKNSILVRDGCGNIDGRIVMFRGCLAKTKGNDMTGLLICRESAIGPIELI